ncbi:TetR/AcrR family transcriptional regulator [Porifericola rhodea]|uniref:TetR/AcrR family transcriptional regulator n=1 Tax=Porifericola rhodea TaxID=930972 RepID=UPI002666264F|nr:TetR/AcrR family transcriptional regulator [Porifericola rhodea]WKN29712.1 TetR/AcrR family transcriptional regulator [Porifericola rhodea]
MGVQERKDRNKQKLRDLILHTAAELFVAQGFEKTSIRNIADAIEYSPGTIYLHFKDKNELFLAISKEGFKLFYQYFQGVMDQPTPIERLLALGHVYIRFAMENPGYYDLMFIMKAPMETETTKDKWHEGENSYDFLLRLVSDCQQQGYFKGKDLETTTYWIWSTVHGLVSLKIRQRLKMYSKDRREKMVTDALELFNSILLTQN